MLHAACNSLKLVEPNIEKLKWKLIKNPAWICSGSKWSIAPSTATIGTSASCFGVITKVTEILRTSFEIKIWIVLRIILLSKRPLKIGNIVSVALKSGNIISPNTRILRFFIRRWEFRFHTSEYFRCYILLNTRHQMHLCIHL